MGFLKSKIFTFALFFFLVLLLLAVPGVYSQKKQVSGDIKNLESKIEDMAKRNDYLNKAIEYFQNPFFLEKEARTRLNYKMPGEEVYFVYSDNSATVSASDGFAERLKAMPNYEKWFYYLMGH